MDNPKPHPFTSLGGKSRPKDKRDFKLGSAAAPVQIPAVYMQDNAWKAPIYYQGQRPACGGHAGTWLNTLLNSYSGVMPNYSPRFTWINIRSLDHFGVSEGSNMRTIFQSLQTAGTDDYEPLENDVTLSDAAYVNPSAVTQAMLDNAKPNVVDHYGFADSVTFDGLKQMIYQNRGVVLLLRVGDEMWTDKNGKTSWAEKDVLPMRPPKAVVDGHFVVAHSYDEKYIYFANSWSTRWGRKGHGYFGADYMPFVEETGTAATVAAWVKDNLTKQVGVLQSLVNLYKRLIAAKNG